MAKRLCLSPTSRLAAVLLLQAATPSNRLVQSAAYRHASTSTGDATRLADIGPSAASVLSQRPGSDSTVQQFVQAAENGSATAIRRLYPAMIAKLVSKAGQTAMLDGILTRDVLNAALHTLATSCRHVASDYGLLWRVFEDLQRVFLVQPSLEECTSLIKGMVATGRIQEARTWIQQLGQAYGLQPTAREWNLVLGRVGRLLQGEPLSEMDGSQVDSEQILPLLQSVWADMLESGVSPDIESYNALLAAFVVRQDDRHLQAALEDLHSRGLSPNVRTHAVLLRRCVDVGDRKGAKTSADAIRQSIEQISLDGNVLDPEVWNALLYHSMRDSAGSTSADGVSDETVQILELMRSRGVDPDAHSVDVLVRADDNPLVDLGAAATSIDRAEELTGATIGAQTVALIIDRLAIKARDPEESLRWALAIYTEAVHGARALASSNELVLPILRQLARTEQPDLAAARRVYSDLQAAHGNGRSGAPSIEVFAALFKLCATATSGAAWSTDLLKDMKSLQRTMPAATVVLHATELMRVAPSHDVALKVLLGFHQLAPQQADTQMAEALLAAWLDVPIPDAPAPYEQTTQIVQQMRFVRAFLGTEGYCSLFRHYGGQNASGQADARAVQRFHTILNLDRYYKPETPVFNELIRAYAGAGAHNAAWSAWQSMLLTPQRSEWDQDTIVAVLDLCGSAVGEEVLDPRPVWRLARTREAVDPLFRLGKVAWQAWVGALARIGSARQLDYATDVVTGQMGRREAFRPPLEGFELAARARDPPPADASIVDNLLRYAHAKGGQDLLQWLRVRVQEQLPELWPDVVDAERFEWDEVRRLREQCRWPDYGASCTTLPVRTSFCEHDVRR